MFFVNLTLFQFLGIFGAVSAGVVALYLWDRSRRRLTVPTLRFWSASQRAAEVKHRRRIQQPWSLLLQLLGIALLLLALAQVRLGSPFTPSHDHVVILDTSAWMAARTKGQPLIEIAQAMARAYVRALPAGDHVMLVRADALATPATAFERNRETVEEAILASRPASTALNLSQAIEFAEQARKLQGGRAGEIVYVGFGRTGQDADQPRRTGDLRVLPVATDVVNCGLRRIGLKRSTTEPDVWEIQVAVQNYGSAPRNVSLALAFGGAPVGARDFVVGPGASEIAAFRYRSRAAGWLDVRLSPEDDFTGDQRAVLEVPARRALKIAVYSDEPDSLRPVLAASPEVDAVFMSPARYAGGGDADIVIFDRFSPTAPPRTDAIWIEPPDRSPVRVRATSASVPLTLWRSDHPLGHGLRTRDVRLEAAQVLQPAPNDIVIAECEAGPVAVARSGKPKSVVLGFHPARTKMRYELATPLLFANILRWMRPDTFRRWELNAANVGTVNVALAAGEDQASLKVTSESGAALPFTRQGRTLRFFAGTPGIVRVTAGDSESVHSLALPELGDQVWTPPAGVRRGLPSFRSAGPVYTEMWPWLALLGMLVLLVEWFLFGRVRAVATAQAAAAPVRVRRKRSRVRSMLSAVRGLL